MSVFQNFVFMGQDLHRLLIGEEVLEMVQDEDSNACFRVDDAVQTTAQALEDRGEGVPLDQVQQLFF